MTELVARLSDAELRVTSESGFVRIAVFRGDGHGVVSETTITVRSSELGRLAGILHVFGVADSLDPIEWSVP